MSATLIIAVVSLTLSGVSLAWQAASFFLAGPRIKVRFREGFANDAGGAILGPRAMYTEDGLDSLERQGFTQPVLAIDAINVGRLATTIHDWSIVFENGVTRTSEGGRGRLPQRLDPHTGATWYHDANEVQRWQPDFTDQSNRAATARAAVELSGRRVLSKDKIVIRGDSIRTLPPGLARRLALRGR